MMGKAPTDNSKGLRLGSFDQIRGIIDEELEGIWTGNKTAKAAMDSGVARKPIVDFEVYKDLEEKKVDVGGWGNAEEAARIFHECVSR